MRVYFWQPLLMAKRRFTAARQLALKRLAQHAEYDAENCTDDALLGDERETTDVEVRAALRRLAVELRQRAES